MSEAPRDFVVSEDNIQFRLPVAVKLQFQKDLDLLPEFKNMSEFLVDTIKALRRHTREGEKVEYPLEFVVRPEVENRVPGDEPTARAAEEPGKTPRKGRQH